MNLYSFIFFLFLTATWNPTWGAQTIPEPLQNSFVRLYSAGKCDEVRKLSQKLDLTLLRPNVMAVVAYCEPKGKDPEALFKLAEKLSPTGDLILVLHGKWAWKHRKETSKEIWEKVLMIARIEYFRNLAKEYLADVITEESNAKAMDLSPSTEFIQLSMSGIHKEHPQPIEFDYLQTHSSAGMNLNAFFSKRKWFSRGSLAVRLETDYNQFFEASDFNQWSNQLETLFAFHVANSKDITVRPFTNYRSLGGSPYNIDYGLGVSGAVYRDDYVQSVQAIIYSEHIFKSPLSPTGGAHYRFEYTWDFYPMLWLITTQFAIDHASSDPTASFLGVNGSFDHSNNKFILHLKFERELTKVTLSLEPTLSYQINTYPSTFQVPGTQTNISIQEEDFESHLKFSASMPLLPSLKLYAWYEWTHSISNLDETAYINRNFNDHTLGLGLRTFISTY